MAPRKSAEAVTKGSLDPRDLSAGYRALADVTRLRILHLLWNSSAESGVTVTDLCDELRISQPLMSWHLRILRRAGLTTTHRVGRQAYCSVDREVAESYGSLLREYFATRPDADPRKALAMAEGLGTGNQLASG